MRLCAGMQAPVCEPHAAPETKVANERARILRFGGAGALSAATDFAVFGAGLSAGLPVASANIAAFLVANAQSYVLNAHLTFRTSGESAPLSFGRYGRFLLAHSFSMAFSTLMVAGLAPVIGPWPAKLAALITAAVWNYLASAHFVFSRNKTGT